ncbi:acetylglutamate kinase [Moheibacter lacus]|nr:acetylglutamate kinase [Moheibacter lacus]
MKKEVNALKIIKIGGGVIDDEMQLNQFLEDFSKVEGAKILVHGGGRGASEQLKRMGIEPKMIDGRRITDAETLEVVVGFYAGVTNKSIVSSLQKLGVNAMGISGSDGNAISGVKRPVKTVDFGFVGDLHENSVNGKLFQILLKNELIPVVCAITHDGNGQLLNTNADTIASAIAKELAKIKEWNVELYFCFDKNGVMKDVNDESSLISEIDFEFYQELKADGIINEGMIPKLDNAFEVIKSGVKSVYIKHASNVNMEIGTKLI